jgi:ADP-dependent phosphofructokinase/glucokinase
LYKTDNATGYKPIKVIMQDKTEYEKLLERAWAELRAFKSKYAMLTELEEIFSLID